MAGKTQGVLFQFTTPVTLAFPNLFTPRKYRDPQGRESGEPKYDLRAVANADHPDLPALRVALVEAAKLAWPNADFANPQAPNFMQIDWCLRAGDKLADKAKMENKDREAFRGKLVLVSRGQYAPGLSAVLNGRIKDFPMSGDERAAAEPYFYGGVDVLLQVQLVGYQVGNNTPVVTAYPNIVLSLNRGEKIPAFAGGAMKSGSAAFSAHIGHVSQVDPTAGMASGIAGLV